jgi:pterin-4a-carbinolamine dehydratase
MSNQFAVLDDDYKNDTLSESSSESEYQEIESIQVTLPTYEGMCGSEWYNTKRLLSKIFKFDGGYDKAFKFFNKVKRCANNSKCYPELTLGWGYVVVKFSPYKTDEITIVQKDIANYCDIVYKQFINSNKDKK